MKLLELKKSYLNKRIIKEDYIEEMFKIHKILYEYSELIKKSELEKIEISSGQVVFTNSDGIRLVSTSCDKRLAPVDVLNFGSYEKDEREMFVKLVDDGFSIFDIGANVGWYSIYFAKKFPRSTVYAFEPVKKTFDNLNINIEFNNSKNVKVFNFGFSNENAKQVFYLDDEESVSASMRNLKGGKRISKVPGRLMRLDDFCKREKLKVDFIKCDVEGAELLVFKGGTNTILRDKPIIFAEMLRKWSSKFSYHPNAIIKLLDEAGYECFFVSFGKLRRLQRMTDKTNATNFFFLHKTLHSKKINKLTK